MEKFVMGVDHGGSSSKAVIFDLKGRVIASARQSMSMQTPKPGFTERDMEQLWQMHCAVIRLALADSGLKGEQIAAVSFSGHGKGLYLWGKDGAPARPGIVSTDSRAHPIVERWYADGTAEKAYPLIHQAVLTSQPVALLRWLMENEPETLQNAQYVFGVIDYVRYRMTGEARGEITNMSGSGLVNLSAQSYDGRILECFGLEGIGDKLPPLIHSAELAGAVTPECARLTGLAAGTPVAGGMFDIDACAIGMNICDDKRLAVIAGTWAINEYIAKEPVTDGSVKMNSLYCLPGYYLLEECSPTSASNYDWFLGTFLEEAAKAEGQNLYEWANALVSSIDPADQQMLFLPYLYGGIDDARTKSVLAGMESWHTRAHVLRAVCEGIVFGHRMQVERLQKSRRAPAQALRLAGGVVRAEGWVQMFSDILQLPVETIDAEELGALGAAMAAAVAVGLYDSLESAASSMVRIAKTYRPNASRKAVYDAKFQKYTELEAAMHRLYTGSERR